MRFENSKELYYSRRSFPIKPLNFDFVRQIAQVPNLSPVRNTYQEIVTSVDKEKTYDVLFFQPSSDYKDI